MNTALALLCNRRSRSALCLPGPTPADLETILRASTTVPDHGRLQPWRLVVVEGAARGVFAELLVDVARETHPNLRNEDLERVARKPFAAPCSIVVIGSPRGARIPWWEQMATAACAAYALTLAAEALGYGSAWKSASNWQAESFRRGLNLDADECVLGWILLGSVPLDIPCPPARMTPPLETFVGRLQASGSVSTFAATSDVDRSARD